MSADLRCGHMPCGDFEPYRYYKEKGPAEVPLGCIKDTVFTVLGFTPCDGPARRCIEFQSFHVTYAGIPFWWRLEPAEAAARCQANQECKERYAALMQEILLYNAYYKK